MKFYGIDCQGKFNTQRLSTLSSHISDDEGRIVYDQERKKLWYGSNDEWKSLSDLGTVITNFTNEDILFPDHIYHIDTTSSPLSGNLYNNAKNGDVVTVLDITGTFSINAFTVVTNSDLILQDTFFKCDTSNQIIQFIYSEVYGWKVDIGGLSTKWADNVQYDNYGSGLVATDVQGAIDEHVMSDNAHAAKDLTYDHISSGLTATNVQDAIDEIKQDITVSGSATLNGTTDNTVQLTGIVTTLGLEVGDVIRIEYTDYDKLHTVESITDDNNIIVNYEHAGNRGNGSLKLADQTATVTIKRISKWYNAPLGLGQAWVALSALRTINVSTNNSSGRSIFVFGGILGNVGLGLIVNNLEIDRSLAAGTGSNQFVSGLVPNGADYVFSSSISLDRTSELR